MHNCKTTRGHRSFVGAFKIKPITCCKNHSNEATKMKLEKIVVVVVVVVQPVA